MITALNVNDIFCDYDSEDYYESRIDIYCITAVCSNNKCEVVAMFEYGFYWELCDKMLLGYFNEMNQIIVDHMEVM